MHNSGDDSLPLTPEEMKAIGEIELGPSRHEQFLNNHYKKLIVIVLVLMLLASAAIVYGTWRSRQEADAAAQNMAAMKVPSGVVSVAEYDAATMQKLTTDYAGTKAAATAELMRGMQLVDAGQEQEGIKLLNDVISSTADSFLRTRAQVFLAGHYMRGGDTEQSTQLWQAVAAAGNTPYLALSLLTLGDLAQQRGDIEMARSLYKQLQDTCPTSPLIVAVQQRMLLLEVDAPEPVAPAPEPEQNNSGDSMGPTAPLLPSGPLFN